MAAITIRQSARDLLWPAILSATAITGSWLFACVLPFAAFAAMLAASERRSTALGTMALIWIANQAVGFTTLGYPADASTALWGVAIGVAALAGTYAASLAFDRLGQTARWVRLALAFAAAFAVYQAGLIVPAAATGELENFAPGLVAQIAAVDAAWLLGLAILHEALAALGWRRRSSLRQPA